MQNKAEGVQNVEVSKKLPCEKSVEEQLEIMVNYTNTHKRYSNADKSTREIECLKVIYPKLFRKINRDDYFAGRLDFLPIGFGCVTSLGGVGHYCVFNKLRGIKEQLPTKLQPEVDSLITYWQKNDVKSIYCDEVLVNDTVGRFIDCNYPMMATARLSGMMLDYEKLITIGLNGLVHQLEKSDQTSFIKAGIKAVELLKNTIDYYVALIDQDLELVNGGLIKEDLIYIKENKPQTLHQAIQLTWLYASIAGCINYGRFDDIFGPFLVNDIEKGIIDYDTAYEYMANIWLMIENRRTTVNGRIIVGGYGRKHIKQADEFTRLCLNVAKNHHYVEPQFTLRFNKETPEDIMDLAYECLSTGATYPTLYNDDVNVKAVEYGMRIPYEDAQQYVPFGCTEFVIQGKSVGTPNILLNHLKILNTFLNNGVDPFDGVKRFECDIKELDDYRSFDDFYADFKKVLDYFFAYSADLQMKSYEIMNKEVSFLFTSLLMDNCIARNKPLLDGGVKYLGGTNEIYGLFNCSDSLFVIKKLVFEEKKYKLSEIVRAMNANFKLEPLLRKQLFNCDKYGNDLPEVDELAVDLYEYTAKGVRDYGIKAGMQYFLIVISNNQTNTEWGRKTSASADGRLSGVYMNPANNPQAGAARNGPTAMLNSLAKIDAKYHGGSVQNIKFTPRMFVNDADKVKTLFKTYFDKGGCHLMVTVVNQGELQDAKLHPENHQDLIVRVSGFSAKFVDLDDDVQDEVISRVLYGD